MGLAISTAEAKYLEVSCQDASTFPLFAPKIRLRATISPEKAEECRYASKQVIFQLPVERGFIPQAVKEALV